MNNVRWDQCSDSLLHSTFCSPFTTNKELTISMLLTSTASSSNLIAFPFQTHLPLQLSNIVSPSSTGPGLLTPFPPTGILPQLSLYTNLPTLQPPFVQILFLLIYPNCSSTWFSIASASTSPKIFSPIQTGFRPGRSTID